MMKSILKIALCFIATMTLPADAARQKYKKQASAARSSSPYLKPAYAAIVMHADSGEVLHTDAADAPRHPASLTKMMTLYMLFKELKSGKISLNTKMPVSYHASSQSPSKLGLRPGETLTVSSAIQALVTKSANDAAVVVAEYLGNTESQFGDKMTQQARAIGMSRTTFKNASGLPNPHQITSARDMATLSRTLYKDFPQFFNYFRLKSFHYKGSNHHNHNHLLGKVEGVDGFKTGFTCASGFNLAATALRYNAQNEPHRLIVVVLGGPTRIWRDRKVESLLETHFEQRGIGEARMMNVSYQKPQPQTTSSDIDDLIHEISSEPKLQKTQWVKPKSPHHLRQAPHTGISSGTSGKWRVQVGAFGSKKDALAAATSARAVISNGNVSATVAKKGRKSLHLAQVHGLSQQNAKKLCNTLKSKGKDCLLLS